MFIIEKCICLQRIVSYSPCELTLTHFVMCTEYILTCLHKHMLTNIKNTLVPIKKKTKKNQYIAEMCT